jgi:hypothetical protein
LKCLPAGPEEYVEHCAKLDCEVVLTINSKLKTVSKTERTLQGDEATWNYRVRSWGTSSIVFVEECDDSWLQKRGVQLPPFTICSSWTLNRTTGKLVRVNEYRDRAGRQLLSRNDVERYCESQPGRTLLDQYDGMRYVYSCATASPLF